MSLRILIRGPAICAAALAFMLSAPLTGCGKLGQLEKPGALSGKPAKEPPRTVETIDPRDRITDPPEGVAPSPQEAPSSTPATSGPSKPNASSR